MAALRRGTAEAESSITPQVSKDVMSFPESLEWEERKPRQSKQGEKENKNYIQEGIAEFVVVIILMCAFGGGGGSGEKGQGQLED